MNCKRSGFTLVELLIAMGISAVFMVLAGRALVEYMGVYEDVIAESYLTSFAQQLKQRVENGYPDGGIREALADTIKVVTDGSSKVQSLEFSTYTDIDSAVDGLYLDPDVVSTTKLLRKSAEDYVIEYNGDARNAGRGKLKIIDMSAALIEGGSGSGSSVTLLHGNENILTVSYTIQYVKGDKSYNYKLRMNVPLMNS